MGFIFYGLLILTAAFSVDLQDLYGTWTWPVEKYGNSAEYGWEEHSMVLARYDEYHWYDEEGNEMDQGDFWLEGTALVLGNGFGPDEYRYNVEVNPEKANSFILTPLPEGIWPSFIIEEKGRPLARKAEELNDREDYEAAVELIQEALEFCHFDNSDVYFELGFALGYLGRHQEAIEAYERALIIDPDDTAAEDNIEWNKKKLGY